MKTNNPIRRLTFALVAVSTLVAGALTGSAAVTPYAWYHAGENGVTFDSAPSDPSNAHAINKSFGHGSSVFIYLAPIGAGGPLGKTGYISTQSTLFGIGHTDANGEWIGGTVSGHDAVPTLDQWNFNYTNWIMECWILPIGNGCLNGPPYGGQMDSQFLSTGSGEYGAQPGGARFTIHDDGFGNPDSVQISARAIGPQPTNNFVIGNPLILDTNRWTHLAVVVDSSSGAAISTFYVNGIRNGLSNTNGVGTNYVISAIPPTVPYFGSGQDTPAPYWGYLDEMRFSSFDPGQFTTNDLLIRTNAGPSITGEPQSTTVWASGAAPFTIQTVFDTTTTYQWRSNGVNIGSATGTRYVADPVVVGNSGAQYDCKVTSSSISVTSTPAATLTVVANNPSNIAAYRNLVTGNPNLVGYYPVDNSSGSTIANTVNASYNGALEAGAFFDGRTNSSFGQRAVAFNGDGDVQIPNNTAFEFTSGNGTIEAVIYDDPAAQFDPSDHTIISEVQDGDPGNPYYFLRAAANGSILLYGNNANPSVSWLMSPNLLGQLTHVAIVFDHATNVTAYVNGLNLGTKIQTNGFGTTSGTPLWIGGMGTSVTANRWYGDVDELALYSAALSQTTIQQHYSSFFFGTNTSGPIIVSQPASRTVLAGASPLLTVKASGTLPLTYQWKSNNVPISGATSASLQLSNLTTTTTFVLNITNNYGLTNSQPIAVTTAAAPAGYLAKIMPDGPSALWRLNESSGTVAVDSAGFNNGTYSGGVTLGGASFPTDTASAAKFNGSDGRAVVPSLAGPASSALNPAGSFTIEYWVEADSVGFNVPISSMNRPSRDSGYEYYLQGNFPGFEWHVGPGGYNAAIGSDDVPVVGTWYHIVSVFDTSVAPNGEIRMYINGQKNDSDPNGNAGLPDPYVPNAVKPFYIGSRSDDSHFWNGSMADVALYNYVLSTNQISNHFSAIATGAAITQQPVGGTFPEGAGTAITLTAAASGQPNTYQWVKDSVPLTPVANADGTDHYPAVNGGFGSILQGVNGPKLVINEARPSDAGMYHLVVTNPILGAQSQNAQVLITADTTPPVVTLVQALGTPPTSSTPFPFVVKVSFNERIDPTSGATAANYVITGGPVTVNSVVVRGDVQAPSLGTDWKTAFLQTSGLTPGQQYTLTVSSVKDQAVTPNTMVTKATTFFAPPLVQGSLWWDYYYEVTPQGVSSLQAFPYYVGFAPTANSHLSTFDTGPITGGDLNNNPAFGALGDNYGDVVSGFITPTVTGDYYFFLDSDDNSELDLSTDNNPGNSSPIATQTGCCSGFQEPGVSTTTSALQHLVAGTPYFVRTLHTEGGGGDYVKVAWRISTDSTPAANLTPIPSQYLSSYTLLPPSFNAPVFSGGHVTITWTGLGTLVQSSTLSLPLSQWTPVPGNPIGTYQVTPSPAVPHMFYQVRQ